MNITNHGPCATKKCPKTAIFRVGPGDEGKVCKDHVPEGVVFAPFLGQQEKFFARTERVVFYGGAVAGGKSTLLLTKFMQQLNHERERASYMAKRGKRLHSRAWGGYFRRVTPDLQQIKVRSLEYFNAIDPEARLNEGKGFWNFPNCGDAKFWFYGMEHVKDRFKFKSVELTYSAWDELTEFEEEQFDYLDTRLRTSDKELEPFLQCVAASNPDGVGLLWVRKRFIEIAPPETVVRIENKIRDGRVIAFEQVFIPSKLTDNPIMMESGAYEAALMNKRPEVREALLEGNWYVIAGAFLSNIWVSSIHVVEDHDIPDGARVFRTMDWGMNAPGSCGWFYMDSDGGLTMFAHLRFQGLVAAKVAEKMQAIEARWGFWDEEHGKSKLNFARNPLDSSCFNTAATAGTPTIAKEFADNGFRFKPAKKKSGSRIAGARQIQRRLMTLIEAAYAAATDPTTRERPMLRFMRSCKSPIETIPILQADPDDPEDVDTKGDDHDWDMVMYACLENPVALPTDEDLDDDDDMPEAPQRGARSGMTLGPPIK